MDSLQKFRKWEPFLHILLWGLVLLFPYIKYLEREGGYPESFPHEVNALIFVMVPCYTVYFYGLRNSRKKSTYLVLLLVFMGSSIIFEWTDSFFHDDTFRPFQWKQIFSSFVKYLAFSLFFVAIFYVKALLKQQNTVEQITNEKRHAELELLKAQVTPHFLFNSLNVLYRDALTANEKLAGSILVLSQNMRYFLKEGQQSKVSLKQEITHIENYVVLQKRRITEKVDVAFKKSITNENLTIVPLLLIPFVENAFKHTTNTRGSGHKIGINIFEKSGVLTFDCINPYSENAVQNGFMISGLGLKNVTKRLQLSYLDKHDLVIKDENGYYKVTLKIVL